MLFENLKKKIFIGESLKSGYIDTIRYYALVEEVKN